MSRIGYQTINLVEGVTLENKEGQILVRGPKGEITLPLPAELSLKIEDKEVKVERSSEEKPVKSMHGTLRALLSNAVIGVSTGWQRTLEVHGSGYKVQVNGDQVELQVGYSHMVHINLPKGVTATVNKNALTLSGIDKQVIGEIAAQIRAVRKPEPYKGKGIRYRDEYVRRKAGKAAKGA